MSKVSRSAETLRRVKRIYTTEGPLSLARRVAAFAIGHVFVYQIYYNCASVNQNYQMLSEAALKPRVGNFALMVVSSNGEADELESRGFEFRSYALNSRERLNRGAIAFCIFVDHELANIGWLATSQQATDILREPPIKVEFSNGEAYSGDSWTHPKYRRMGLHSYNVFRRMEYDYQRGIRLSRYAVLVRNLAQQAANEKFGDMRFGKGRYLKILWWKWWKEKPLTQT